MAGTTLSLLLISSSIPFFQKANVRSTNTNFLQLIRSYLCSQQCLHFFSCASQVKTVLPRKPAPSVVPLSQSLPQWLLTYGSQDLETVLLISAESVSIKNMHWPGNQHSNQQNWPQSLVTKHKHSSHYGADFITSHNTTKSYHET